MTEYQARLLDVSEVYSKSELTVDHASGILNLNLYDTSDFDESGGQLEIEGTVYTYNTKDDDLNTIELASGTTAFYSEDTEVFVYPYVVVKEALIQIGENDADYATIPQEYVGILEATVRGGTTEISVVVEYSPKTDEYVVKDVPGDDFLMGGEYIPPATTDGLVPPTPTGVVATGGTEMLFIQWNAVTNPDLVYYDVHVSTTTPVATDGTKLVGSTTGTSVALPMEGGTYYALVIARDEDGSSPPSLEDSAVVNAVVPIDPPDVPTLRITGMPRGFMIQVTNAKPGWEYTYQITNSTTSNVTSFPVTARPLLYTEQEGDGTPLGVDTDYTFKVTATNSAGSAATAWIGPFQLVLNDSSTISELSVGKLLAGDLVGAFALLGALNVGSSISITPDNGIEILQPDNKKITFPANGTAAQIASHLDAFSLTVQDRLSIRGKLNEISTDSEVVIAEGITPPNQPPSVSNSWPKQLMNFAPGYEYLNLGLARHATSTNRWFSTNSFFDMSIREATDAGAGVASWQIGPTGSNYWRTRGCTLIGNTLYVLFMDPLRQDATRPVPWRIFVRRYDTANNMAYLGEWEYAEETGSPYYPAIGRNEAGTRIIIGRCANSGKVKIREYAPDTGVLQETSLTGDTTHNDHMQAVHRANDGNYYLAIYTQSRIRIYPVSTMVQNTAINWQTAESSDVNGFTYDSVSGRYYTLSNSSQRYKYSNVTSPAAASVEYSWFDSDLAGTGQHETARGPAAPSFTRKYRAYVTIIGSEPNDTGGVDDPDTIRIWVNGFRQTPDLASGVVTMSHIENFGVTETSKAADFPTAASTGRLRSAKTDVNGPLIDLYGSGAGRVGPLKWDAAGDWDLGPVESAYLIREKTNQQTISHNTQTSVAFNTYVTGTSKVNWNGTDNEITFTETGLYLIKAQITWDDNNSTGFRRLLLQKNGSGYARVDNPAASVNLTQTITCIVPITATTDKLQVALYQNSGGGRTIGNNGILNRFEVAKVGTV